jgi:hypothetical protein
LDTEALEREEIVYREFRGYDSIYYPRPADWKTRPKYVGSREHAAEMRGIEGRRAEQRKQEENRRREWERKRLEEERKEKEERERQEFVERRREMVEELARAKARHIAQQNADNSAKTHEEARIARAAARMNSEEARQARLERDAREALFAPAAASAARYGDTDERVRAPTTDPNTAPRSASTSSGRVPPGFRRPSRGRGGARAGRAAPDTFFVDSSEEERWE